MLINVRRKNECICPVCGLDMPMRKRNSKLDFNRYLPQRLVYFIISRRISCYECKNCGHTLLDIPEDMNLKFQSNFRRNAAMSGDIINNDLSDRYYSNREWILNGRVAKVDSFVECRKSIFDIGCGGGYVLDYYKRRNHGVAGIEIDDLCVSACRRLGIDCMKGDFLKADINEKYDVVMAWHCLEHIPDINAFLGKMVAISNENGLVIIEVPIDRPLVGNWESYDGHVHYFTKESLERLVDKFNLKCIYSEEGVQKPAWLFIGEVP